MRILIILVFIFSIISCKNLENSRNSKKVTEYNKVVTETYELSHAISGSNTVLVLFGGFPEIAVDVKREFQFLETAKMNGISVLYMNFNRTLWLENSECQKLAKEILSVFKQNNLEIKNVYFGGFSSGGNVALLLLNYLNSHSVLRPKGVFVVDSPVDLLELYRNAQRNVERNFSEPSVNEGKWLIKMFESEFNTAKDSIADFEKYSPYTFETQNVSNLSNLNGMKIRFYTEPDTIWWKENRQNELEDLNAYYIEKLSKKLTTDLKNAKVELIKTENKGYRSNGMRHPHSWSIVDKDGLVDWMME